MRIVVVNTFTFQAPGQIAYDPNARPIWEIAAELGATVPAAEWDKMPPDLAKNLDHYLYGAREQDA